MVTSSSASWYTSLVDHTFWPFVVILSLIFTLIQLQLCLTYSDQVERCKPQSFSTILIDKNKNLSWRNKEWTRQSAETFVRVSMCFWPDLCQISRLLTPHISGDMSVPNSPQDWDILVFLSPCLLRHAPTLNRTGHPAGPISEEHFSGHGDIRFWTHDKCRNQIFSIFYISSSTGPYGEPLNLPFWAAPSLWHQRKKRTEWQHPVLEF